MKHLKPVFLLFLASFFLVGWETKEIKQIRGIQPGNLMPEMNWTEWNPDNKEYVLLQFWAAYDAESRLANTQMYRTISKSEEIQMISFSLDKNPAVFEGVLRADKLPRDVQFSDFLGENSPLYKQFHLQAGFGNWLINRDGMIIARNLSPQDVLNYQRKS
jgi:hypothetical protein